MLFMADEQGCGHVEATKAYDKGQVSVVVTVK